jgi:hypothetical protein
MDDPAFDLDLIRAALASSRLRIERSRRRIVASRLLSCPIRGGDGSGPTVTPIDLRRRIRSLIDSGILPALLDRRSWVGQGHGEPCLLCDQPITPTQWEYEVDLPPLGEVRSHALCFRIWFEESVQQRKSA